MKKTFNGENTQMPASVNLKEILEGYEADMADAFATEVTEFSELSDEEKVEWIKQNDKVFYNGLIKN